ncbi:MAG: hypothetical protein ACRDUY_05600 [Nitriliruptorales bacterium]
MDDEGPHRRTSTALAGAGVIVVLVVALVAAFGVRRLPEFPDVADAPQLDVPGTIAYVTLEDGENCAATTSASGAGERTTFCPRDIDGPQWINQLAWTPDGNLIVLGHGRFGEVAVVVDPESGRQLDRIEFSEADRPQPLSRFGDRRTREDGAELAVSSSREGVATLSVRSPDGDIREIVAVDGPRDYTFRDASWSPDGEWILIADGDGRLLVVSEDGDPGPRLLLDGAQNYGFELGSTVAWFIPGDDTYTIDPASLDGD